MGVIIGFANQKGGVGKTITCSTVAAILHNQGYHVLSISADPQRNLDMIARYNDEPAAIGTNDFNTPSLLHVLKGEMAAKDVIVPTDIGDLLRASSELNSWNGNESKDILTPDEYWSIRDDPNKLKSLLDNRFAEITPKEKYLYKSIQPIKDNYDFILIDTNPSLGLLTTNALYASDYIVIPAFSEASSFSAIIELVGSVNAINTFMFKEVTILGLLMTRCEARLNAITRYTQKYSKLAKKLNIRLFNTKIRKSARAQDYIDYHLNLYDYDRKGKTTQDYLNFVTELLDAIKEEEKRKVKAHVQTGSYY